MRFLLLVGVLAGCGAGGAVEAPVPEGAVRLRFAWPSELDLAVAASLERVQAAGGREDSRTAEASWVLAAERDGVSWRVSTRDVAVPEGDVPPVVAALAFGAHPAFLVDKEGKLGEVVGADELRLAAAPVMADMPPPAQVRFQDRMSDEALSVGISEEWEALVGRHAGRTLVPGLSEPVPGRMALPIAPDVVVDTLTSETWERVPCGEADCVRITWTERLAPEASAALTDAMREDIAAGMASEGLGQPTVTDLGLIYAWELVTEPETLVPHRLAAQRTMTVKLALDGTEVIVEQRDAHSRDYTAR